MITIDPPPPAEAAGSSLLYSVEFYRTVQQHLAPGGILQQFFPARGNEAALVGAAFDSLQQEFAHVKVMRSLDDYGLHFLASQRPFDALTVDRALERMPAAATQDLMEWFPGRTPRDVWESMLKREVDPGTLVPGHAHPVITDDRPFNEYFLLRRLFAW